MRVVLAAFEPFGGRQKNRSLVVARRAARKVGLRVHVLPVRFARLSRAITALLSPPPDVLLLLGEHGRAHKLHLERIAHNRIEPRIPDNANKSPRGPVRGGSPATLRATLPLRAALAILSRRAATRLSDDAGRFACNASLYHALDHARRRRLRTRIGFIHIPVRHVPLAAATSAIAALLANMKTGRAPRSGTPSPRRGRTGLSSSARARSRPPPRRTA